MPFGKLGWRNGIMFHKISIVRGYEAKMQTLQTFSSSWVTINAVDLVHYAQFILRLNNDQLICYTSLGADCNYLTGKIKCFYISFRGKQ